jgi:hypothetical protein
MEATMVKREATMIPFIDTDSGDEAVAVVRATETGVGLSLSLRKDGDIAVFLRVDDCERLITALQQTVLAVRGPAV